MTQQTQESRLQTLIEQLPAAQMSMRAFEDGRASLLVRARAEAAVEPKALKKHRWFWLAAAAALLLAFWSPRSAYAPLRDERHVAQDSGSVPAAQISDPEATAPKAITETAQDPVRRREAAPGEVRGPKQAPPSAEPLRVASSSEVAFREGWSALRRGNHELAVAWLSQVAPSSPLAEDAQYWRGRALWDAGEPQQAIAVFEDFVERYPAASRRAEVAVLLGKLLQSQQHYAEAGGYLAIGLLAEDEATREQARQALEALGTNGAD
jgi:TolA-binding protein